MKGARGLCLDIFVYEMPHGSNIGLVIDAVVYFCHDSVETHF